MNQTTPFTNSYKRGTVVTVTAPMTVKTFWIFSYKFKKWSDGNTSNVRSFTMTQNFNITAQYALSLL